ncbi:GNAT family N-acetyltransferase [Pseudomonas oryzihabitans]|uniref:GNAT family N-acetyltransferase n=1 Tax=Pseudomonas oryzihabitans TaxID=47885 RepID=UPI0028559400|nr:GNAT family N-acetyltransferase [Pseudomonas psychrotolerans]MDR6680223.1 GNAT superfamily N-acetyltransferase [Pseudomonas psychrotolerans]
MTDGILLSNHEYVIRKARPEDGVPIRKMVFRTFVEYRIAADPDDDDRDIMSFGVDKPGVLEFVSEFSGVPKGSAILTPDDNDTIKLTKFYLDKDFRGYGAGRAMLNLVVEQAAKLNYKKIYLRTRASYKEAVSLYESTGWIRGPDRPGTGPERYYYRTL